MLEIKDENYILIASDIHDDENSLEKLIPMAERSNCLAFLYAGDLNVENYFISSLLRCRNFVFIPVQGNCDNRWSWLDLSLELPLYRTCSFKGLEIFLTHGHMYSDPQSAGLDESRFNLVVNGHSHVNSLYSEIVSGKRVTYLNPGSPSRPRGGSSRSYALVRFNRDGSALAEIRALDGDGLLSQEAVAVN